MSVPRRWLAIGLCAVGLAAVVFGLIPRFGFGWLIVLLCPLSHLLMMGSHGRPDNAHGRGAPPRGTLCHDDHRGAASTTAP